MTMNKLLYLLCIFLMISCEQTGLTESEELRLKKPVLGRTFFYKQYQYDRNMNVVPNSSEQIEETVINIDSLIFGKSGATVIRSRFVSLNQTSDSYSWIDTKGDFLTAYQIDGKTIWSRLPVATLENIKDTIKNEYDYGQGIGRLVVEQERKIDFLGTGNIVVDSQNISTRYFKSAYKATYNYLDLRRTDYSEGESIVHFSPNLGVVVQVSSEPYFDNKQARWVNGYMKKLIRIR